MQYTRRPLSMPAVSDDAIAVLRAEHRQLAQWLTDFQRSRSRRRREHFARLICEALREEGLQQAEERAFDEETSIRLH